ncbi:hypothetical protein [Hymenobacter norwichensis]|uniref:hypothetical protein n=1 Tax=Hymenobacter norwichensis TaxID=223903 RepID=UPI0004071108|nr:hypothetical protein [Hymenobacter norwichensis]
MPTPAPPVITCRFFVVAGLGCLLLCSGFLLLIFGPTPYAQILALGRDTHYEGGYQYLPLAVTPASYQLLRYSLAVLALGSFGGLVVGGRASRSGQTTEARLLWQELRAAVAAVGRTGRGLSGAERLVAGSLLALILTVRAWYLAHYVLGTDEVASYDYFVRPGPLTISCFYPIPNNHLFFNLVCWPLTWLTGNARLVMRLPTFAASAASTVFGYLLLLRWGGFRVATLATTLFCLLPLSLYYAVAGRGYFLQFGLLLLAFFAVLAVLQRPAYQRLGWLGFMAASVLGFYTIPTFAYPFASLSLGLLLGLGWQRSWPELGHLALAVSLVGAATVLLYWPVGCVSGWRQLVGNRYVVALPDAVFWPQYPRQLRILADTLAGNNRVGLVAGTGLLLAGPVCFRLLPGANRSLAALAWLLLALPLPLIAAQKVQTPARTLFYTTFFACTLGSLLATALLTWLRMPKRRQLVLGLAVVGAYGGNQLRQELASHYDQVREQNQMEATYAWLVQQGKGNPRVLLAAPDYELFFRHYAQQESRPLLLHITPAPRQTYDFTVQGWRDAPLPAWALPPYYVPVYRNRFVVIYARPRT